MHIRDKSKLKPAGRNALPITTCTHTPPRELRRVVRDSALHSRRVLNELAWCRAPHSASQPHPIPIT